MIAEEKNAKSKIKTKLKTFCNSKQILFRHVSFFCSLVSVIFWLLEYRFAK